MTPFNVGSRAAEELCKALKQRQKHVEISSVLSLEALLEEAYRAEPRLTGIVLGWKGQRTGSALTLSKTYSVDLEYSTDFVDNLDDVIIDHGSWKPSDFLAAVNELPKVIQVVTKDAEDLQRRVRQDHHTRRERFPGMHACECTWHDRYVNGCTVMWIRLECCVDPERYKMYDMLAKREVERVASQIFGKGNIPKLLKTFLAFSYLQQTCEYDQEMADLLTMKQVEHMERPWVSLAYGALRKRMAVCEGVAAAFKLFMDFCGVPNRIVFGSLSEDYEEADHCWNMVCLDGKHYHIDATYGLNGRSVFVGAFLKSDAEMRQTHHWDPSGYPACTLSRIDYDYVEDYVSEHMDELLRLGVDEKYLCPDELRE